MIIRYDITLGASTTAGGKVITADPCTTINGIPVAHEDDQVSCPACNTVGVIKPAGRRLSDTFNGRQVALSGDHCICNCHPPPRLIENQTYVFQQFDGEWHAGQEAAASSVAAKFNKTASSATTEADGIALVLLDPDTDEPYRHRPYKLQLHDSVITGITDQNGATRPLTAEEHASFTHWHVENDTAPA